MGNAAKKTRKHVSIQIINSFTGNPIQEQQHMT